MCLQVLISILHLWTHNAQHNCIIAYYVYVYIYIYICICICICVYIYIYIYSTNNTNSCSMIMHTVYYIYNDSNNINNKLHTMCQLMHNPHMCVYIKLVYT